MLNLSDSEILDLRSAGVWYLRRHYTAFQPAEHEDIVQNALCKLWRRMDSFRGESTVKTWFIKIVITEAQMYYRTLFKSKSRLAEIPLPDNLSDAYDMENSILTKLRCDKVLAELNNISAKRRQALEMFYLHGFTISEISEQIGAGETAVKARLFQGKKTLREQLKNEVRA